MRNIGSWATARSGGTSRNSPGATAPTQASGSGGAVSQERARELLEACHVLVHPSLHDSSPFVCIEAMGAGRPVICLDLGGPAAQVTAETGFKVRASTPRDTVSALARLCARSGRTPRFAPGWARRPVSECLKCSSGSGKGKCSSRLTSYFQACPVELTDVASQRGGELGCSRARVCHSSNSSPLVSRWKVVRRDTRSRRRSRTFH